MPKFYFKSAMTSIMVAIFLSISTDALALKLFGRQYIQVVVHHPFINMYTGPGRGYPVFHVVERGAVITIKKRRTDWYKVVTEKGKVGWVRRDKLNNAITTDGDQLEFTPPGRQEYVNRKWELSLLVGDFSDSQSFSAIIGYHLTPNLATELKYASNFGDFSNTQLISLNMVNQPFPSWRISPFFTLGAGQLLVEPDASLVAAENRDETAMTVGGGFLFYLSRRFIFRTEYNNHTVLTNREANEEVHEWKAGISVFF